MDQINSIVKDLQLNKIIFNQNNSEFNNNLKSKQNNEVNERLNSRNNKQNSRNNTKQSERHERHEKRERQDRHEGQDRFKRHRDRKNNSINITKSNLNRVNRKISNKRDEASIKYGDSGQILGGFMKREIEVDGKKRIIEAKTKNGNMWDVKVMNKDGKKDQRVRRGKVSASDLKIIFGSIDEHGLERLENIGNANEEGSLEIHRLPSVKVNLPPIGLITIQEVSEPISSQFQKISKNNKNQNKDNITNYVLPVPEPRGKYGIPTPKQMDDLYTLKEIKQIAKNFGINRKHDGKQRSKDQLIKSILSKLRKKSTKSTKSTKLTNKSFSKSNKELFRKNFNQKEIENNNNSNNNKNNNLKNNNSNNNSNNNKSLIEQLKKIV